MLQKYIDEITVNGRVSLDYFLAEFYKYYSKVVSFDEITDDEIEKLKTILDKTKIHESFKTIFTGFLREKLSPIGVFQALLVIDNTIADYTVISEELIKIFNHQDMTKLMKEYIRLWIVQPFSVIEKLMEMLGKLNFPGGLDLILDDKELFEKALRKSEISASYFNLLNFISYSETETGKRIYARLGEVLDINIAKTEMLSDIIEKINQIPIDESLCGNTGINNLETLRDSTNKILAVHQAYPTMQANLINFSTRSISGGGINSSLTNNQIIKIYSGDYSDYESGSTNSMMGGDISYEFRPVQGLIMNPSKFNQLTPAGQRKLAQDLPATRRKFNKVIIDSIGSVQNWFNQLFNNDLPADSEAGKVITALEKSYSQIGGDQGKVIDWFMNNFAPTVNVYRSRKLPPTGNSVVDAVFGGDAVRNMPKTINGGNNNMQNQPNFNRISGKSGQLYGGGSIQEFVEQMQRAQLDFNTKFDKLYRQLTDAVSRVADNGKYSIGTHLQAVINALSSLAISSPDTVMKISGIYPTKDLSVKYLAICEGVVKTIETLKISGFGEVLSTVKSLAEIVKDSRHRAAELQKKFADSAKTSVEIIKYSEYNEANIPSKLTIKELHMLVEAINRLLYTNTGNDMTIKSDKKTSEDIKEFIAKATDRDKSIDDHYTRELNALIGYGKRIDNTQRKMIENFVKSNCATMKYINKNVDTKLLEWRHNFAKQSNITKSQVEKIEQLVMIYTHYKPSARLLELFKKLDNFRKTYKAPLNLGAAYQLNDLLRKIFTASGHMEMIEKLYTELGIEDKSFNWQEFRTNIVNLMCNLAFGVSEYKVKKGNTVLSRSEYVTDLAKLVGDKTLEPFVYGLFGLGNNEFMFENPGTHEFKTDSMVGNPNYTDANKIDELKTVLHIKAEDNVPTDITDKFNNMNDNDTKLLFTVFITFMKNAGKYLCIDPKSEFTNIIDKLQTVIQKIKDQNNITYTRIDSEPYLDYRIYGSYDFEKNIVINIFKGLLSNVLTVLNKYIGLRYTGTYDLPVVNNMLGGGEDKEIFDPEDLDSGKLEQTSSIKTSGGNALDIIGMHDLAFDKVIDEAVPFYVIAMNIFQTYYTKIFDKYKFEEHKDQSGTKYGIFATISKFSALYPIYEIYKDYGLGKLESLNDYHIRLIVSCLNKIWASASGSGKDKLLAAIDSILAEINASLVYTTKAQYDLLKQQSNMELSFDDMLDQQFGSFNTELASIITEYSKISAFTDKEGLEEFEAFLNNSVAKSQKTPTESGKLLIIRELLTEDSSQYHSAFDEYFKFCEFVIMPIIIAAVSYSKIFSLFNEVNVTATADGTKNTSIDLRNVYVDDEGKVSVWYIIQQPFNPANLTLVGQYTMLCNSSIVAEWNRLLIINALLDSIYGNDQFDLDSIPLWLPMLPNSKPKSPVLKLNTEKIGNSLTNSNANSVLALKEIFPYVKTKYIKDFYLAAIREFTTDFDHLLHNFMSFPGINDRFINALEKTIHDKTISIKNIIQTQQKEIDAIGESKLQDILTVPIPLYPATRIPPYIGTVVIPSIEIIDEQPVQINSTPFKFKYIDQFAISIGTIVSENIQNAVMSIFDWIIFKLAECNSLEYTLPIELFELIRQDSIFNNMIVEALPGRDGLIGYLKFNSTTYYNIVTQNIIARTLTDKNKAASVDVKVMRKEWISSLVSFIPELINKLTILTESNSLNETDDYGISISVGLRKMISALHIYYENIVQYAQFIPFLGSFVPAVKIENQSSYHPIAELLQLVSGNSQIQPIKLLWANQYFYPAFTKLPAPNMHGDIYADLKHFGGDIFANSIFATEFKGTMEILGKCAIRAKILSDPRKNAKTRSDMQFNYENIIDRCLFTIANCFEMDPKITSKLVMNIINHFITPNRLNPTLTGGDIIITADKTNYNKYLSDELASLVKELLKGIIKNFGKGDAAGKIKVANDNIAPRNYTDIICMAISILYDNPNTRPLFNFSPKIAQEIVGLDHLMMDNFAFPLQKRLERSTENYDKPYYQLRSEEWANYATLQVKSTIAANDNTKLSDIYGTFSKIGYNNKELVTFGNAKKLIEENRVDINKYITEGRFNNMTVNDNIINEEYTKNVNIIKQVYNAYNNLFGYIILNKLLNIIFRGYFDFDIVRYMYLIDTYNEGNLTDSEKNIANDVPELKAVFAVKDYLKDRVVNDNTFNKTINVISNLYNTLTENINNNVNIQNTDFNDDEANNIVNDNWLIMYACITLFKNSFPDINNIANIRLYPLLALMKCFVMEPTPEQYNNNKNAFIELLRVCLKSNVEIKYALPIMIQSNISDQVKSIFKKFINEGNKLDMATDAIKYMGEAIGFFNNMNTELLNMPAGNTFEAINGTDIPENLPYDFVDRATKMNNLASDIIKKNTDSCIISTDDEMVFTTGGTDDNMKYNALCGYTLLSLHAMNNNLYKNIIPPITNKYHVSKIFELADEEYRQLDMSFESLIPKIMWIAFELGKSDDVKAVIKLDSALFEILVKRNLMRDNIIKNEENLEQTILTSDIISPFFQVFIDNEEFNIITSTRIIDDTGITYIADMLPSSLKHYMLYNPLYELNNIYNYNANAIIVWSPFTKKYDLKLKVTDIEKDGVVTEKRIISESFLFKNLISSASEINNPGYHAAGTINFATVHDVISFIRLDNQPLIDYGQKFTIRQSNFEVIPKILNLINEWCDKVVNLADGMEEASGFTLNMVGGTHQKDFINMNEISSGDPYQIYPRMYLNKDNTLKLGFYEKIHKSISKSSDSIYSLAMRYFNRTPISFSGLFSNFLFPNCLYSNLVYNSYAERFSEIINTFNTNDITGNVKGNKNMFSELNELSRNRFNFYANYIVYYYNYASGGVVSDYAASGVYQYPVNTEDKSIIRKADSFTIKNMAQALIDNPGYKMVSQFSAPSICPTFMAYLTNLLVGKSNTEDKIDNNFANLDWLFQTDALGIYRSLDGMLTYISAIVAIVKYMSIYDIKNDEEVPYASVTPSEPYAGENQIDLEQF